MFKRIGYRILTTMICALAFVAIAAAHEVIIAQPSKVGSGPELQAGTYRVEVVKSQDSAEVRFFKGGEMVLNAPASLVSRPEKCEATEVHYDLADGSHMITEIRLQGSKEGLVFKTDKPIAN